MQKCGSFILNDEVLICFIDITISLKGDYLLLNTLIDYSGFFFTELNKTNDLATF